MIEHDLEVLSLNTVQTLKMPSEKKWEYVGKVSKRPASLSANFRTDIWTLAKVASYSSLKAFHPAPLTQLKHKMSADLMKGRYLL